MGCAHSTPTVTDAPLPSSTAPSQGHRNTTGVLNPSNGSGSVIASSLPDLVNDVIESEQDSLEMELSKLDVKQFDFKQLQKATKSFKEPDMVLGEGAFGKVFKGFMKDPQTKEHWPIAVKRLDRDSGIQGHQQWVTEIRYLARLQHPNLIHLWGYCSHKEEAILVLEYMPLGSLDYLLFKDKFQTVHHLSWNHRVKIISHMFSALHFLHNNNIIHRDIKAANVLLDKDFNAKLTDFGLVKESSKDKTHDTLTKAKGTIGYIDPNYVDTGHLNSKSDVYGLGILMLELLTGKKSEGFHYARRARREIDTNPAAEVTWIDPRIAAEVASQMEERKARRLARIALMCVAETPEHRPDVAKFLDKVTGMVGIPEAREGE